MRAPTPAPLLLCALLALAAGPLRAQTLGGVVVDAATGQPIPGAAVTVLDGERRAARGTTGADGTFQLELRSPSRAGRVRIRAERVGYRPTVSDELAVQRYETVEVRLPLSEQAVALQPVTVTARQQPPRIARLGMVGFYDREAQGFGRFLRREEIERPGVRDVAEVVGRLPGTTLITSYQGSVVYFARAATVRAFTAGSTRCLPDVYLDGVRVTYGITGLSGLVPLEHVEAIEAYSGPSQTPVQWSGTGAACGVIVIWTRSSR
jgi:hypothetical protein